METACMAVPRQVSNRGVLREEAGGSADSSVTARTPVPPVSPGSLERLVSPAQVTESPGKNLWEQICEEYEAELPTLPEGYKVKQEAAVTVSSVTPLEELVPHGFNMEHYFPVHSFPVVPPVPCPPKKTETVEPKTCSPRDYLEMFIFPVLLPGMANLLHQAKREKCFEDPPSPLSADLYRCQVQLGGVGMNEAAVSGEEPTLGQHCSWDLSRHFSSCH